MQKGDKMKKTLFSLAVLGLIFGGCTINKEVEDKDKAVKKETNKDGTVKLSFSEKGIKDKTFFKVNKKDEQWKIFEYDFNATHYKANQIQGGSSSSEGNYTVTNGYLKLSVPSLDMYIWIKPISKTNKIVRPITKYSFFNLSVYV